MGPSIPVVEVCLREPVQLPPISLPSLCVFRWREWLRCRGGADHGEPHFLIWEYCSYTGVFKEHSPQSKLKNLNKCLLGQESGSWVPGAKGHRQLCWGSGTQRCKREIHMTHACVFSLSRNGVGPLLGFNWMTNARRCWKGTHCLSCLIWNAKVWLHSLNSNSAYELGQLLVQRVQ